MRTFNFTKEYEGYTLTGTYECDADGDDVEIMDVFINGSKADGYELLKPIVIDWLRDSLWSEARERVEELRVEAYYANRCAEYVCQEKSTDEW